MGFLEERARFLVGLVGRYADPGWKILEAGCRAGKNLAPLHDAGFRNLCGVEEEAGRLDALAKEFPRLGEARLVNAPFMEAAAGFSDGEFDLVFTVGFFEGERSEDVGLFGELARIAGRYLVVVEDERPPAPGAGPRDYGAVFERLGFTRVHEERLEELPELNSVFTARAFARR